MKWREADPEGELVQAVARYLEIIEAGEDANAYLRSLGPLATEVRAVVGIESVLRMDLPAPTAAELARGRNELHKAITSEGRRHAGPKLFGMIGAAGLGLALGAGFASGAVPSEPILAIVETIPFMNSDDSGEDGPESAGVAGAVEDTTTALPVSASTVEPENAEAVGAADARPETPASTNGRGVVADGTPPGQGGQIPGNGGSGGNGVGSNGTPPGQGGENPGNGGGNGNSVGSDGTPPGQGGENPGNGNGNSVGSDGTPPGQGGDNPGNGDGNGVGSDGTPPGQGGENPGNGGENGNGVGSDGTPPGQGGDDPGNGGGNGNGVGSDGTPPGQGGDDPGNGGGNGNGNNGNGNGNGGSN